MELSIETWVLDTTWYCVSSIEHGLCFLIFLKKPRLSLAWWGWFGENGDPEVSTFLQYYPLPELFVTSMFLINSTNPTSIFPRMAGQHPKSLLSHVLWQFSTRSRLHLVKGTGLLKDTYRSPRKLSKGISSFLLSKFLMNWCRRD